MESFVSPVGVETTREAAKLTVTQTARQIKRETPTSAEFCCKKTKQKATQLLSGVVWERGGLGGWLSVLLNLPQQTFISKGPVITDPSTDGPSDFSNNVPTPCRRHVKVNDATAAQSSGWCAEADNIDPLFPSAVSSRPR